MNRLALVAMTSVVSLALSACDNGDNIDIAETAELETERLAAADEFDPMARDYRLSEEQQASRAEFDETTFQDEYRGYRDEIVKERKEEMAETGGTGEATAAPSSMASRDSSTNMRARRDMSWSYLDRNSDGKLSVAEYAIWAIPLDPTRPAPNDETAPYLTSEEANKAADSFFYFDTDGDTYLSQREFTAARSGDLIS